MKIAIVGTTTWGMTLGMMLAARGIQSVLWARTEEEAAQLSQERQNRRLLPGLVFPPELSATASVEAALRDAYMVILAVPSQTMRENVRRVRRGLSEASVILSAVKGIEVKTTRRMSEVLEDELEPALHSRICVLSGPNLSGEILRRLPSATVVASRAVAIAEEAQRILMSPIFRVYTSADVVGVELGGSLKNIVALGAGMADGLGYGDNGKAALMTRGLAEIARLGIAAGANPLTFAGLAGIGDLVATCSSRLSRNHYVGEELGKGRSLPEVMAAMKNVAEGIPTTVAARQMAAKMGVEMPITEEMYRVLFEGEDPRQAVAKLMSRQARRELTDIEL
ncbi:MAG: NAD(P)-dependent glycerol-3-phosphate dehydrogenase [Chloroflexi bacterium]|nr:NAD(P)-dependent glycerol-3-phosphate dehydrogenase [Chloroflexota bacterium]